MPNDKRPPLYEANFYFSSISPEILPKEAPLELRARFNSAALASIKNRTPISFKFHLSELLGTHQGEGSDPSIILNSESIQDKEKSCYLRGRFNIPYLFIDLLVSPDVYLPRRLMINTILMIKNELREMGTANRTFLDMGCGTGLVGIALKKRFPELNVIATDISSDTIDLAKKNALLNEVDIEFLVGDLFAPLQTRAIDYVAFYCPQSMRNWENITEYSEYYLPQITEPIAAFDGGADGLELLERFCAEATSFMQPRGIIWLTGRCMPEAINWLSSHFRVHAVTKPACLRYRTFFFEKN